MKLNFQLFMFLEVKSGENVDCVADSFGKSGNIKTYILMTLVF